MSISSPAEPFMPAAMPPEPVRRFGVSQYHRMIAAGILADDDPLELLEGWLVPKMVKNPAHSTARHVATKALEQAVPPGWHVRSQEPITLDDSEPEPDIAVVRGDPGQYARSHPGPRDVALVVEVADASLVRDRSLKSASMPAPGFRFTGSSICPSGGSRRMPTRPAPATLQTTDGMKITPPRRNCR